MTRHEYDENLSPMMRQKGVSTVICDCDRLCLCQCVIKVPRHLMHELDDIQSNDNDVHDLHIARQCVSLAMNEYAFDVT